MFLYSPWLLIPAQEALLRESQGRSQTLLAGVGGGWWATASNQNFIITHQTWAEAVRVSWGASCHIWEAFTDWNWKQKMKELWCWLGKHCKSSRSLSLSVERLRGGCAAVKREGAGSASGDWAVQFSAACYARQFTRSQPLIAPEGLICLPEWRSLVLPGWESSQKGLGRGDRSWCVSLCSLLFSTEDYLSNHISVLQFLTVLQELWLCLWMGEVLRLHLGFFQLHCRVSMVCLYTSLWRIWNCSCDPCPPPCPLPKDWAALVVKN